jgi:hypothetical protein
MPCEHKTRLLKEYEIATRRFSDTVTDFRQKTGTSPKTEYDRLQRLTDEARVKFRTSSSCANASRKIVSNDWTSVSMIRHGSGTTNAGTPPGPSRHGDGNVGSHNRNYDRKCNCAVEKLASNVRLVAKGDWRGLPQDRRWQRPDLFLLGYGVAPTPRAIQQCGC